MTSRKQARTAMPDTIEDLLSTEARLDRSFAAAVVVYLAQAFGPVAGRVLEQDRQAWAQWTEVGLTVLLFASYLWFAFAAGAAARRVGRSRLLVVGWIVLAPFLALLPLLILPTILGAVASTL